MMAHDVLVQQHVVLWMGQWGLWLRCVLRVAENHVAASAYQLDSGLTPDPSPVPASSRARVPCAGTSLSDVTRSISDIFESDIAPKLAARPDLFPKGETCLLPAPACSH